MTTFAGTNRGETFTGYSTLEVTVCTCGVLFAIPEKMLDARRDHGGTFYCPHGHSLVFTKTTEQKLAEARRREQATRELLQAEERSNAANRAAATRARNERDAIKQRVAGGVCPCCKRSFKELARHMQSKHPDYLEQSKA